MINSTLQQLKIKPLPKAQEQFNIILNIPQEGVAPNIIDKTSEHLINRDRFFSDIQEHLEVVQKGYNKLSKMANIKGDEELDKDKITDKITDINDMLFKPVSDDIASIKKPKISIIQCLSSTIYELIIIKCHIIYLIIG